MSVSRGSFFSIQGSNLFLLQWQADFLPLSHLGSAELMFLQTTRVLWRRKECQGPSTPQSNKANWEKPSIGHLVHPCWLPSFLWCSCPPVWSMEDWRQALPRAPKCLESKAHDLVLPNWPHYPHLLYPKVLIGRWGPTSPALLPLHFSHINPGQEEEVPTLLSSDLAICSQAGCWRPLPKVEEVS